MGWLGKLAGGIVKSLPGIGDAISIGSGVVSAISGGKKQGKADALTQQQIDLANQRFAAGAPFRSRLAELAARPTAQREDLSGLVADPGNPYARTAPRPSLASMAFAPPRPTPMPQPVPQAGGVTPAGMQKALRLAEAMRGRMAR